MAQHQGLQRIGRYEIVREIGRGGMGVVYEAQDTVFERRIALKLLPREQVANEALRARFLQEARLIASLEHEAIVPVYDYGEEEGQPFFAMQLMPGGSLADRLQSGPLPAESAVAIVQRIAPALDEAHRASIIHRDLKPGNILFDAHGLPYVSDFGIAKLLGVGKTAPSQLMGTPAYMSPEQMSEKGGVDGRSDLYALGIVIWEMLTGSVPFSADTPIQVALQHLNEPPPLLRQVRPDLPKGLEGVLSRALAKAPGDRFQTVGALAGALQAAVPATRPLSPPVAPKATPKTPLPGLFSTPSRPVWGGRRGRGSLPILWLAGGGLLLVALLAGLWAMQRRPNEQLTIAAPPSPTATPGPTRAATRTVRAPALASGDRPTPVLPTAPAGSGAIPTSTRVPELPTATPLPTFTPVPTREPGGRIVALSPASGVQVRGALVVRVTVEGSAANVRGELWMGGDPLYRVTQMSREGSQFSATINQPPNGNYGNWRWQVRLFSENSALTTSDARPFVWVAPVLPTAPPAATPIPAATATFAPTAVPTEEAPFPTITPPTIPTPIPTPQP